MHSKRILALSMTALVFSFVASNETWACHQGTPHGQQTDYGGGGGGVEVPVGGVIMWVADLPPDGWLLCDGSAVTIANFQALFDVIGTIYGDDGGSNERFNLPDLRGRIPLGQDDMGGNAANRVIDPAASQLAGASGGETIDTGFAGFSAPVFLTAAQSGLTGHTHDVNARAFFDHSRS